MQDEHRIKRASDRLNAIRVCRNCVPAATDNWRELRRAIVRPAAAIPADGAQDRNHVISEQEPRRRYLPLAFDALSEKDRMAVDIELPTGVGDGDCPITIGLGSDRIALRSMYSASYPAPRSMALFAITTSMVE